MPIYGFECFNGHELTVEAEGILEAMALAEEAEHSAVKRGRCLDGFDNDALPGIPAWMLGRGPRPTLESRMERI